MGTLMKTLTPTHKSSTTSSPVPTPITEALWRHGLLSEQLRVRCPQCGRDDKTKLFPDLGLHCYRDGWHMHPHQVKRLPRTRPSRPAPSSSPPPELVYTGAKEQGVVDTEVYTELLRCGSVKDAIRFYCRAIGPVGHVVEPMQFRHIPPSVEQHLTDVFGEERLQEAGLYNKTGWIPNRYPIALPMTDPVTGEVVNLQFRRTTPIPPGLGRPIKVMNLSAGGRPVPGYGWSPLRRAVQQGLVDPSDTVLVFVEGDKDVLVAVSLGWIAIGIPGVSNRPDPHVLAWLRDHPFQRIEVRFDPDQAGRTGAARFAELLRTGLEGTPTQIVDLTPAEDGPDLADRMLAAVKRGLPIRRKGRPWGGLR